MNRGVIDILRKIKTIFWILKESVKKAKKKIFLIGNVFYLCLRCLLLACYLVQENLVQFFLQKESQGAQREKQDTALKSFILAISDLILQHWNFYSLELLFPF